MNERTGGKANSHGIRRSAMSRISRSCCWLTVPSSARSTAWRRRHRRNPGRPELPRATVAAPSSGVRVPRRPDSGPTRRAAASGPSHSIFRAVPRAPNEMPTADRPSEGTTGNAGGGFIRISYGLSLSASLRWKASSNHCSKGAIGEASTTDRVSTGSSSQSFGVGSRST